MGSLALSSPESRSTRSVGRVHLASISSIMIKFVLASCLAAATLAQFIEPEKAKILKEQRFNAGDGRFGAAYAQEETTADGERVGQYSYIDQAGKTITGRDTAGKDGFRILEGGHVPTGADGQASAQFVATPAPAPAPRQQFAQQPQQRPVAPAANANPFINPHDPTHRNFNFNRNGGNFGGRTHQASVVPPCADCAGVNPFINPFDASHRNPASFAPAPTAAPRQQQFQQTFQQQPQQFAAAPVVTEAPRNFFPPGQLQLNRFENGFNFDFTSQ